MLFGIDFCGRRQRVRRRRPQRNGLGHMGVCLAALGALVFLILLFIAPQWLLVLLVALLTAALIASICIPVRK